jgi:hypothetical protein
LNGFVLGVTIQIQMSDRRMLASGSLGVATFVILGVVWILFGSRSVAYVGLTLATLVALASAVLLFGVSLAGRVLNVIGRVIAAVCLLFATLAALILGGTLFRDYLPDGRVLAYVVLALVALAALISAGMLFGVSLTDGRVLAYLVLALSAILVLIGGAILFGEYARAEGDGKPPCGTAQKGGVGSVKPARWRLENTGGNRLIVALDDWVDEARRDSTWVRVIPTAINTQNAPLRGKHAVRAFVLRRPSTGKQSLQLDVTPTATRSPDGRAILVELCAMRSERRDASPGRYRGVVRVAGRRIDGADIPFELTIKGQRRAVAFLGILTALLGAVVAAFNSKAPAPLKSDASDFEKFSDVLLRWAPFLGAMVAGLSAAFVLYADDPTWGASLGADTTKLIAATFAAGAGGLALTAPPARAIRQQIGRNESAPASATS